jgi:hypothetical protein
MKELENFKKYLIEEEISKSSKTSNRGSDIKGTEAAKKAEWKARYGSMDGFDKAYPQYSKKENLNENESGLITFEQLKQACIENYNEYNFSDDGEIFDDEIANELNQATNVDELVNILDGMGFNGNGAYDFMLGSILK